MSLYIYKNIYIYNTQIIKKDLKLFLFLGIITSNVYGVIF